MPNWNYCRVQLRTDGYVLEEFATDGLKGSFVRKDKADRSELDAGARAVATLGEQGWELVGLGTVGSLNNIDHWLYFKRASTN